MTKRYYFYRLPKYLEKEAKKQEYRRVVVSEHTSVVLFEGSQEKAVVAALKASGLKYILDTVNGRKRALVCGILDIPDCDTVGSDPKLPNSLRTVT